MPKHGKSVYQISLDDGIKRALEIVKQQEESKRIGADVKHHNMVAMDTKGEGKLAVGKTDEKSIKKSTEQENQDQEKETVTGQVSRGAENVPKATRAGKR